jgi:folylpolyglutamate synthase/dihydrofolate synthase
MSYNGTINYLYNLRKHGIKFGLNNISRLMSALDNPHKSFLSIHVAGTNGKGSTSAIIASILKTAGPKVGLFTSPHILSFTERIRVNGEKITESEVVSLTEEIKTKIENTPSIALPLRGGEPKLNPTFFEFITAMALLYFKRKNIDIAVIETGMGGRLDATNIVIPEVTVIAKISYDHREFLGNTLKKIAHEKAGIIKDGTPVVASYQDAEAMKVIERKATEKDAELYVYGRDFSSVLKREDISGICFDYRSSNLFTIHDLVLPLTGEYQMENASVAIKAVELFLKKLTPRFSHLTSYTKLRPYLSHSPTPPIKRGESQGATVEGGEHTPTPLSRGDLLSPLAGNGKGEGCHFIREGLENVRWPGRLEIVKEDPTILIDGAHNPAAAEALSNALVKNFLRRYKRIIFILGIMVDKDIKGIMEPLLHLASEIVLTSPDYERAASPAKLAEAAASLGFPHVIIAPTVRDAIEMAENICQQSAPPPSPFPLEWEGMGGGEPHDFNIDHRLSTADYLIVVTGSFYTIGEAKEVIGHKGVLTKLRE